MDSQKKPGERKKKEAGRQRKGVHQRRGANNDDTPKRG